MSARTEQASIPYASLLNTTSIANFSILQVADIICIGCGSLIGWTYLKAHEQAQRYKEGETVQIILSTRRDADCIYLITIIGKFIVEKERITRDNAWELDS